MRSYLFASPTPVATFSKRHTSCASKISDSGVHATVAGTGRCTLRPAVHGHGTRPPPLSLSSHLVTTSAIPVHLPPCLCHTHDATNTCVSHVHVCIARVGASTGLQLRTCTRRFLLHERNVNWLKDEFRSGHAEDREWGWALGGPGGSFVQERIIVVPYVANSYITTNTAPKRRRIIFYGDCRRRTNVRQPLAGMARERGAHGDGTRHGNATTPTYIVCRGANHRTNPAKEAME